MVKLAKQNELLFLNPLALGHIDVDADHLSWLSIAIIRNELPRLDPPDLTTPNNAMLRGIFAPPLTVSFIPLRLYSSKVLRVHARSPLAV
jgi:hypothetical protein